MDLEEQVVSLGLARSLREAGVAQNSQYYWINTGEDYRLTDTHNAHHVHQGLSKAWTDDPDTFAAFSVAELGEMLPRCYMSWSTPQNGDFKWWCRVNEQHMVVHEDRPSFTAEKEADARGKMLLYLTRHFS